MSLKKLILKSNFTYKIYLYYNLYIRHKCFINRSQYSQWGEDLSILKFFKDKKNGIYFDVGCFHPLMYSNTCLLFKNGWSGINIDINPTSIDLFKILRPLDFNICTALNEYEKEFKVYFDHPFSPVNTLDKSFFDSNKSNFFKDVSFKIIKSKSIDEILNLSKYKEIDFLNIDVEGLDLQVLVQLVPNKLKPSLISIETHNVDGSKSKDCDKINDYLKNCKFYAYKRVGPSTLYSN